MIEGNSSFPCAPFANEIILVLVRLVESLRVFSVELVPLDVDAPLGCRLSLTAVAMSIRGLVSFCQRFPLLHLLQLVLVLGLACSPAARARAALTVRSLVPAACPRGAAGQFNLDSMISALR